ncbi:MAG: Gfo/Idh/MocA family oxidoreductase [Planctomycetota bacterium]|nr:Gfo/Idh/MocA family oxidoreductase [Planctomycetota bacterium]MDA1105729.1 Gfo/Idh/MocA family oxidoreductase [Planctomycetota bacterium]
MTTDSKRRTLLAAAGAAALVPTVLPAFGRQDTGEQRWLKVGVVGCGGRGTGAAMNALEASESVSIVALGDVFADRAKAAQEGLAQRGDRGKVADDRIFVGFDAIAGVLATDCDIVILATPPGFRPGHFEAAIAAGKNVFMEKPVAVDPVGIRKVIAAAHAADEKKLCVVSGTQRRHEQCYLESMKRIHDGALGKLSAARAYWNMGGLWVVEAQSDRSDMENQVRNWLYYTWLSGDHIVEQHVHNLDVVNWAFQAVPERCVALGGRQARTDPKYGQIFDHFAVDYEYPDQRFALSMCRQQDGTDGRVQEQIFGSEGVAVMSSGSATIEGANAWKFKGPQRNPYVQEHIDLQEAIRTGKLINEGVRVAESTLTAIMGRMSAYTGKVVTWDEAMNSDLDLMPAVMEFTSLPTAPVAIPGKST